ncbi:MAG: acetyl-CoA C-acetyltransferase [Acidimicrobiales bacterium]
MRDAVVCEPVRTPVGRYGGVFRDVPATELAAAVVAEVVARTGVAPEQIDDVLLGQCYPNGEAPGIGRVAALDAGLPVSVTGYQLDRRCGSGLQSIINAAMQVQTGASEIVLAGGVESMSQAEYYTTAMRWGARSEHVSMFDRLARGRVTAGGVHHPVPGGMIETAENLRREYRISRGEQDELALRSHQRAVAAQQKGAFDDEIVPVTVHGRTGETVVDTDEHPRPDTTLESLSALRAVMVRQDPEATVTAGNSSGQNDGASLCLVTHPDKAAELGLRPLARLRSWAVAGVEPSRMGIGPVAATARALELAGVGFADIGLIELNEAFASQVLACTREWGFGDADFERLNVHGSGISLGHPVGATGGRILATLLREMDRRGASLGLETMCIGGGQGLTAIFEAVD